MGVAARTTGLLLSGTEVLVHVFPGANPGPAQLEAMRETERYLDTVANRVRKTGVAVRTTIPYDAPALGIADQAEFRHADLIVMNTHAPKWPETLLHPSVTMSVLEHTNAPILAFKSLGADQSQLPRFMTDPTAPILVPLDGSLLGESVLALAEGLATTFGNPLLLVRSVDRPHVASTSLNNPIIVATVEEWAIEETQSYLQRKQLEVTNRGVRVTTEISVRSPAWFIEECTQAHNAGLIVIASHGRSGLGRFLLGSVAQSVLRQSAAPVLLVRLNEIQVEPAAAVSSIEQSLN